MTVITAAAFMFAAACAFANQRHTPDVQNVKFGFVSITNIKQKSELLLLQQFYNTQYVIVDT